MHPPPDRVLPPPDEKEEAELRSVALQNAASIVQARLRAEEELRRAQEALRESQERLQAALAAADTGTFRWDLRSGTFDWDENMGRLLGLEPRAGLHTLDDLLGAVHPGDRGRVAEACRRAAAEGAALDLELCVRLPGGGVRWLAEKGKTFRGERGEPLYVTGACVDITRLKRAEETLRQSEEQLRCITDAAPALISYVDASGRYRFMNRQYEIWFGHSRDAMLGKHVRDALGEEAFERLRPHVERALAGESTHFEAEVPYRDAGTRFIHGSYIPDRGEDGAVRGFYVLVSDITERRRVEEALQRAAEERTALLESERTARTAAERLSEMKDEFLATLSHELRTPLNAIVGWAHVLRQGTKSPADLAKGLDTIERNARMQAQLIEDLLDMSRITSGKMRLDVQPIQPLGFVQAALDTVRPAAEAKGIRLDTVLDPAAGPISGDPSRLQQVVWNLLSNAIKFTPRGGSVQVLLQRVESQVELVVADTGAGIRPEFVAHLFERFRQADASTTRKHGGLGLGLSIVKHLLELHGGTVEMSSPGEGLGTTVIVRLPVLAAQRDSGQDAPRPPGLLRAEADLLGIRVLVVDDQEEARELIRRVLEDCRATVLTAASTAEALALLDHERPDLLVSDIGMPEADGFELLRRVRALGPERGRMPAIALTAFARSEDRTRALRAGFLVHVAKPVDPAELVATVATVTGRVNPQA